MNRPASSRASQLFYASVTTLLAIAFTAMTPPACTQSTQASATGPVAQALGCAGDCAYQVVRTYPHDREAFTQGLVIDKGVLFESTGLNGRSSLRRVDLATGKVLQRVDLPYEYFGEGITVFGDQIIMLTWRNRVGWVIDKVTFECLSEFTYPGEGWGITHDGERLIMSDGTATLRFLDPATFAQVGSVVVRDGGAEVRRLNELEYINGEVFANVWQTDNIVRINPDTGAVNGWINCAGLLMPADHIPPVDVLNGIAWDNDTGRLFVTGKLWPKLFEIELVELTEKAPF